MNKLTLIGLLAALAAGSAFAQTQATSDFAALRAPLSSSSENPAVEDESVSGSALVLIQTNRNGQNLTSAVVGFYVSITSAGNPTFTAMHIHKGSSSENGNVVIDSSFGSSVDVGSGPSTIFREVTVTSTEGLAAIEDIMANPADYYVNVHSMKHPNGVARGQLETASFDDAEGGPSHSELSSRLNKMQETLSRIARRLGVVPAGEDNAQGDQ